jgi:hypothetical protein
VVKVIMQVILQVLVVAEAQVQQEVLLAVLVLQAMVVMVQPLI